MRGRTPQARTTRSASSRYPSANSTPVTRRGSAAPGSGAFAAAAAVAAGPSTVRPRARHSVWISTPIPVRCAWSRADESASSWRSISRCACCARTTCAPRAASARAAETPSRPPPTTTARTPGRTAAESARQSSMVRKACTPSGRSPPPGANRPRSGGSTGLEPVARTRVSYRSVLPSSQWTVRSARSMRTARTPRRSAGPGGRQGRHFRCVPVGQHLGEEHPVVRDVRFLAQDGDRRARSRAEPLREPQAREAAADHHHMLVRGHVTRVRVRCFPAASLLLPRRNAHLSAVVKGR